LEIVCGGETWGFDVRVISGHSEVYQNNGLRRLDPILFGKNPTQRFDFNPARDDKAALQIARFTKMGEYAKNLKVPCEARYMKMDAKEVLPEERRQLKQVKFIDPLRNKILFTPLLFQVGGAMTPESSAFI
jgi:hypothetical protein